VRQYVGVHFFFKPGNLSEQHAMLFRRYVDRISLRRHHWDLDRQAEVDLIDQLDRLLGGKNISGHRAVHKIDSHEYELTLLL